MCVEDLHNHAGMHSGPPSSCLQHKWTWNPHADAPPHEIHIHMQAFRRREVLELARRNPYSYTLKPRLGTALQLLDATEYVTRWVESSGMMRLWHVVDWALTGW